MPTKIKSKKKAKGDLRIMRSKNNCGIRAIDEARMVKIVSETTLFLGEYLSMDSDLFVSRNGKVKIYSIPAQGIIRIDIKINEY